MEAHQDCLVCPNVAAFARLARAEGLAQRNREYIQAAETLGAGTPRITIDFSTPLNVPIMQQDIDRQVRESERQRK